MSEIIDSDTLHRTAKYFMDNGRAETHDEAMGLLRRFGLTICVGSEIAGSIDQQAALLTLINLARRTFLAGVDVIGVPAAPSITPLAVNQSLRQAVKELGGNLVEESKQEWPSALIGNVESRPGKMPCWRLTWDGWRGGVIPAREERRLPEGLAVALTPILAAAACAAEAFSYNAGDHPMAGRRTAGISLWHPGADWLTADPTEPQLAYLPSRLWLIGLGNLGQAFAWTLASLPYAEPHKVQLVLQDFDRIAYSNESTSVLASITDVGRRKARVVADWLDARGFETFVNELRFGAWTRRADSEPNVALCGVDNALARMALEKPQFGLVVEAGLGAGPEAFRSLSVHTFPASRTAEEIWSRQAGRGDHKVEDMPAYRSLKREGMDSCGLARLASRTVGVPFVGLIAACLALSELLRRLNGGHPLEMASASVTALDNIENVPASFPLAPYAFGHLPVAKG
jgi:hypothetical protein